MSKRNPVFIEDAFSGTDLTYATTDGPVKFKIENLGELALSSGCVVAADPLMGLPAKAFSLRCAIGKFPVLVSIAQFQKSKDQRVAFAMLRFRNEPATEWQLATFNNDDANESTLADDEYVGYAVDSGNGCFMDDSTNHWIGNANARLAERFVHRLEEALQDNYRETWCWANTVPDSTENDNVISFSAGWGNGMYPSYFGYDAKARLSCLVTDFLLLTKDELDGASAALGTGRNAASDSEEIMSVNDQSDNRKWWKFW